MDQNQTPKTLHQHYSLYKTPVFLEDLNDASILKNIIDVVVRAGSFAVAVRQLSDLGVALKGEEDYVTKVDTNNQDYLVSQLLTMNLDTILGLEGIVGMGFVLEEDTKISKEYLASGDEGVFIYIDPIDGTTSFKDGGDNFCVGVSIERRTGENLFAVIYIPSRQQIIVADHITKQAYWFDNFGKKHLFEEVADKNDFDIRRIAAHYNPVHREKLLEIYSFLAAKPIKWFGETEDPNERFGSNVVPGSLMIDLIDLAFGKYDLVINGSCHLWDIAGAKHILDKTGYVMVGWDGKAIDVASYNGKDQALMIIAGKQKLVNAFFEKIKNSGINLLENQN